MKFLYYSSICVILLININFNWKVVDDFDDILNDNEILGLVNHIKKSDDGKKSSNLDDIIK